MVRMVDFLSTFTEGQKHKKRSTDDRCKAQRINQASRLAKKGGGEAPRRAGVADQVVCREKGAEDEGLSRATLGELGPYQCHCRGIGQIAWKPTTTPRSCWEQGTVQMDF